MKKTMLNTVAVLAVLAVLAANVSAQAHASKRWEGRAFLNLNGLFQIASPSFQYSDSMILFLEEATAEVDIPGRQARAFDIGGGVRLVENFGVGVTYSRYQSDQMADLTTTIPHPLLFSRPAIAGLEVPLARTESVIHIQAIYMIPVTQKLQVGVLAGPSRFSYEQELLSTFRLQGRLGPDLDWSVTLMNPETKKAEGSCWGYNVGTDLTYLFNRRIGVGFGARYSRASADIENALRITRTGASATTETIRLGGLQFGGGLRIRF